MQRWLAVGGPWIVFFAVLVLATWRLAVLLDAAFPSTADDAYITLRYSRNLVEGAGVAWNRGGPPVEGYSNFLFVLLGALALAIDLDPMLLLKQLSVLALFGCCIVLWLLGRRELGPFAALAPVVVFTAAESTVWWTVRGLETVVYQLLLLGATILFLAAVEDARPAPAVLGRRRTLLVGSGLCIFVASLARFEGPVIGLCFAALLAGRALGPWRRKAPTGDAVRQPLADLLVLTAAAGLPYLVYFGWRLHEFGRWIPNSYACKAVFAGDPAALVRDFVGLAGPFLVLAIPALLLRRTLRTAALALPVVAYLVLLWGREPTAAGSQRLFLPVYGNVLVLAFVGLQALARVFWREARFGTWAGVALLVATLVWVGPAAELEEALRTRTAAYLIRTHKRMGLARFADRILAPDEAWVLGDVGAAGYVSRRDIVDAYCLNSPQLLSLPIAGSDERFADWIFETSPGLIALGTKDPRHFQPVAPIWASIRAHPELDRAYRRVGSVDAIGWYYWLYVRSDIAERRGLVPAGGSGAPGGGPH